MVLELGPWKERSCFEQRYLQGIMQSNIQPVHLSCTTFTLDLYPGQDSTFQLYTLGNKCSTETEGFIPPIDFSVDFSFVCH